MIKFKASAYQIIVQESEIEGETFFVGSAREIPDVAVYEDSFARAYKAITQVIEDLYAASVEEKRPFPQPMKRSENQASGRVTLRLPKTLHAILERQAATEDTSLNQHLVYLLADASARVDQMANTNTVRAHMVRPTTPHQAKHVLLRPEVMALLVGQVVKRTTIKSTGHGEVESADPIAADADFDQMAFDPQPFGGSAYARNQ